MMRGMGGTCWAAGAEGDGDVMCEKRRYVSREMADSAIGELRRKKAEPKRRSKWLNAYPCRVCGYFHIGHSGRRDRPADA